jgi:hypothetical protein
MFRIIQPGPYDPTYNLERIAKELESIPNCGFSRIHIHGLENYLRKYQGASSEKRIYLCIQLIFNEFKALYNQLIKAKDNSEIFKTISVVYEELKELLMFFVADYKNDVLRKESIFNKRIQWIEYCKKLITLNSFELGGLNDLDRPFKEYLFDEFDTILNLQLTIAQNEKQLENKSEYLYPLIQFPTALMALYVFYLPASEPQTRSWFKKWRMQNKVEASFSSMYNTFCQFTRNKDERLRYLRKYSQRLNDLLRDNEKAFRKLEDELKTAEIS